MKPAETALEAIEPASVKQKRHAEAMAQIRDARSAPSFEELANERLEQSMRRDAEDPGDTDPTEEMARRTLGDGRNWHTAFPVGSIDHKIGCTLETCTGECVTPFATEMAVPRTILTGDAHLAFEAFTAASAAYEAKQHELAAAQATWRATLEALTKAAVKR